MKKHQTKIRIIDSNGNYTEYFPRGNEFVEKESFWISFWRIVKWLLKNTWELIRLAFFWFKGVVWPMLQPYFSLRRISVFKVGVLVLCLYVLYQNNMQLNFALNAPLAGIGASRVDNGNGQAVQQNVSILPGVTTPESTPVSSEKEEHTKEFISRFAKVAVDEMHRYQIPASIKMGQAILESNAGMSVLSKESYNFFGMKCRSKCKGCTCRNYEDDDVYDMFRVFSSAWESWRAHSLLLMENGGRYEHLKKHGKDYKKWAKGLKKAGYATDPKYPEKLINIIERYKLYKLDQL